MFKRHDRDSELQKGEDDPTFSKTVDTLVNPLGGLPLICTAIQMIREDQYIRGFVADQETEEASLRAYREVVPKVSACTLGHVAAP
jgi:hypothetical protein